MNVARPRRTGHPGYNVVLPREPKTATEARHLVHVSLSAWGRDDTAHPAELVISELVATAVRPARGPMVRVIVGGRGRRSRAASSGRISPMAREIVERAVPYGSASVACGVVQLRFDRRGFGIASALARSSSDAPVTYSSAAASVRGRDRARATRCPAQTTGWRRRTLAACARGDHYAMPSSDKFAAALGHHARVLSDGHVAAPEQMPQEFVEVATEYATRLADDLSSGWMDLAVAGTELGPGKALDGQAVICAQSRAASPVTRVCDVLFFD
ncbi:hypothetical protein [Streptomyces sp. MMS24-I29]|uniref:hypothetical protein n=1 Tax=Streptomyces sp. MMS24-I29 TaxID=3351480 RepID=UPI003C7B97BC